MNCKSNLKIIKMAKFPLRSAKSSVCRLTVSLFSHRCVRYVRIQPSHIFVFLKTPHVVGPVGIIFLLTFIQLLQALGLGSKWPDTVEMGRKIKMIQTNNGCDESLLYFWSLFGYQAQFSVIGGSLFFFFLFFFKFLSFGPPLQDAWYLCASSLHLFSVGVSHRQHVRAVSPS